MVTWRLVCIKNVSIVNKVHWLLGRVMAPRIKGIPEILLEFGYWTTDLIGG